MRASNGLWRGRARWGAAAALALALLSGPARAEPPSAPEGGPPLRRPGDEPLSVPGLPVPDAAEEEGSPRLALPSLPPTDAEGMDALALGLRVHVNRIRIEGSRAFPESELHRRVEEFEGREISSEDLRRIRDRITRLYLEHGYVSSGAVIPDQDLQDGVLLVRVVEGRLAEVSVTGNERLRSSWIAKRAALGATTPLDVEWLQSRLQILHLDPRIRSVHAVLGPGARPGESHLDLRVEEERAWGLRLRTANDRAESVGGVAFELLAEHRNVTGFGDEFELELDGAEGLREVHLRYAVPLNRLDTTLRLYWQRSDSEVVERPFDEIDIEAESRTLGVSLLHPILRTPDEELWFGIAGERRRSDTSLLGEAFSFSPGPEDGEVTITALRLFQEWARRTRHQILAARSTLSFGVDAFGATLHSGDEPPDGRYLAWLAQVQWVRRLRALRGSQLVVRGDLQLASEPLLSLEQFAIGGFHSVRGYRENTLVRDNGFAASVELRFPLLRSGLGEEVLELAPFLDAGRGWNHRRRDSRYRLTSAGLGLRYRPTRRVLAEVYWGARLNDVERAGDRLQDHGWHFRLALDI